MGEVKLDSVQERLIDIPFLCSMALFLGLLVLTESVVAASFEKMDISVVVVSLDEFVIGVDRLFVLAHVEVSISEGHESSHIIFVVVFSLALS
jgi:hypothetical protein